MDRRQYVALTVSLTTLLVAGSLSQAAGQTPNFQRTLSTQAYAEWEITHGRRPLVVYAEGLTHTDADGAEKDFGLIGLATCIDRWHCIGTSALKGNLGAEAFEVSPDLDTGHLSLRWGRRSQTISWDGDGTPSLEITDPTAGEVGATRPADAEGEVLRRDLADEGVEHYGFLARGNASDEPQGEPRRATSVRDLERLKAWDVMPHQTSGMVGPSNTNNCIVNKPSERRFKRLINRARVKGDENKLWLDTELSKIARRHTREMIQHGSLYHSTAEQMRRRATHWTVIGENIGMGGNVSSLHDAFMNSPPHRQNLLYPTFRFVGVGVKRDKDDRMWVSIIFENKKNPGTTLYCPRA